MKKLNLEEGSLVFFTEEGLKDWKTYLDIAVPGVIISGGEWIGYELQSIFTIYISPIDYSSQVILLNIELLTFPYTGGFNDAISLKSGEKLMILKPDKLNLYILMTYLFSFLCSIFVINIIIFFANSYFLIMSPNDEIYLKCCRVKFILCWYIFVENAYYFFMGVLKGYGYLKNTTIATIVMFFVISPTLIYILAFRCNIGVKGIWESTSISMTLGDILFIYWVFSFDLTKMKELANKRIYSDNKNINIDESETFLKKNENNENKYIEDKKKDERIEMNFINN